MHVQEDLVKRFPSISGFLHNPGTPHCQTNETKPFIGLSGVQCYSEYLVDKFVVQSALLKDILLLIIPGGLE